MTDVVDAGTVTWMMPTGSPRPAWVDSAVRLRAVRIESDFIKRFVLVLFFIFFILSPNCVWLIEETFVRVRAKNLITLGVFATTLLLRFGDKFRALNLIINDLQKLITV